IFTVLPLFSYLPALAQQTAADFFKITINALKFKDYDNTILFATKAIELNPRLGGAYWNRAIAYDNKMEYHKSIRDYDSAMKYYANSTDLATLHKNRGMVYSDMKMYASVIGDVDKLLEMNPGYGAAFWNSRIDYSSIGSYDSAINDYTRAMKYFTSLPDLCQLHLLRGLAWLKLNKDDKANKEFREILKLDTSHDYHTAYAKYMLHKKDSAINDIRIFVSRVVNKEEEYAGACFNEARLYAVMDNHAQALSSLEMSFNLGYKNFRNVETERDFDNVRKDEKFIKLVKKYEAKDTHP